MVPRRKRWRSVIAEGTLKRNRWTTPRPSRVVRGEYHWHKHDDEDEFFFVVSGRFLIDLGPGKGFVVRKGVRHRPRAPERTVNLMVERAGILPTGDG